VSGFDGESPAGDGATGSGAGESVPLGPECRICPLCQAMALLRQVRPETVDQLATAVTDLVAMVRVLAAGLIPDLAGAGVAPESRPAAGRDSRPDADPRPAPAAEHPVDPDGHGDSGPQDAEAFGAAGSARRAGDEHVMQWIEITD